MNIRSITLLCGVTCTAFASAVTWDNFPTWDGNVTNGWLGQAQIAAAPAENILTDYRVQFDTAMTGQNVTFSIRDWDGTNVMGATYFSDTFAANGIQQYSGLNLALVTGTTYAFVFDFQGYAGASLQYDAQGANLPGFGAWFDGTNWSQFPTLDQKATITWSAVPEPGTMAVVALGLAALARRKKKS